VVCLNVGFQRRRREALHVDHAAPSKTSGNNAALQSRKSVASCRISCESERVLGGQNKRSQVRVKAFGGCNTQKVPSNLVYRHEWPRREKTSGLVYDTKLKKSQGSYALE
jgi:hypothetical protein